jgi:hypothetical protein
MTTKCRSNQFSIAGLFFVMCGLGLFFAVIPHLYTISKMSPPWSVFVLIILMFSWCMIPIRTGSGRAWWIGFLVFGSLYLSIALVAEPHEALSRLAVRLGELTVVFGTLLASLLLSVALGAIGGAVFARTFQRLRVHTLERVRRR